MATRTNHIEMETDSTSHDQACWGLLDRISASSHLRRAPRLKVLLQYLGERSLNDRCERLHEHDIGSHVFHRPDSYDTSVDNIVRTSVSDLRRRIEAYFNSEGSHEPFLMEIPRGSYIPVFRYRAEDAETPVEGETEPPAVAAADPWPAEILEARVNPRWMPAVLALAAGLSLVLAVGWFYTWRQYCALQRPLYAWQSEPTVSELWSRFLDANPNTDIVISDTGIGLAEALSHKAFSLNDYLSQGYISQLQSAKMSPDMHAAVNRVLSWNLANPDEFTLARRLLALDPLGKNIHLYNSRNYIPDLVSRDNVILIGARKSNPWDEMFDSRLNFITDFDGPRVVNRSPLKGEQATYVPAGTDGFCIIAYMPNPDHRGLVMLIEGTNAEATEAAGDFLFSEDQLSGFKKILGVAHFPYFQVLLKVSAVRDTPLSSSIEAYRTY